jgi:hypothetical protein
MRQKRRRGHQAGNIIGVTGKSYSIRYFEIPRLPLQRFT